MKGTGNPAASPRSRPRKGGGEGNGDQPLDVVEPHAAHDVDELGPQLRTHGVQYAQR